MGKLLIGVLLAMLAGCEMGDNEHADPDGGAVVGLESDRGAAWSHGVVEDPVDAGPDD